MEFLNNYLPEILGGTTSLTALIGAVIVYLKSKGIGLDIKSKVEASIQKISEDNDFKNVRDTAFQTANQVAELYKQVETLNGSIEKLYESMSVIDNATDVRELALTVKKLLDDAKLNQATVAKLLEVMEDERKNEKTEE